MKAAILAGMVTLTACAQTPVNFTEDVTLTAWQTAKAIQSVRFPAASGSGDLEFCIAKSVSNNSITFADSADSFFGAYTGTYYQDTDSQTAGGGSIIQHSSDQGVVALGVTSYEASALVKRFVRFKLTATPGNYEFTDLEQVQANSGVVPNTGFTPIGAFSGASPDLAIESLRQISENINACRNSGTPLI